MSDEEKKAIEEQYKKGLVNLSNVIEPLINQFKTDYSLDIQQCRLIINYLLMERDFNEDYYDEYDDEPYLDEENDYDDVEEYEEPIKLSNGITDWKVGDTLVHQKFGDGVVTKLLGNNILEVEFTTCGQKTILGSHYMVSRK